MATDKTVNEKREVSDFNYIHIRDIGELILSQGDRESLVVEAEPELIAKVKTKVKDGKLILELGGGWLDKLSIGLSDLSGRRVRYIVTVRELNKLKISGKVDVTAGRLDSDRLSVGISGMGRVDIDNLSAKKLSVEISGRGEFSASGSAIHQDISVSGSADYRAGDLESQSTVIRISGQGNAKVWAVEELDVTISGYGNVEYRGNPSVNQTISGLGSVRQLEKSKS
jgi:hypothetical protein